MNNKTCCFTGHRRLPKDRIGNIIKRLNHEIDNLIAQGVTNFISGGALGFDQIAASLIINMREQGQQIRLLFALPCKNQDEKWNDEQRRQYNRLLSKADEVIYISEEYNDYCMEKRNRYMVERSGYCVCALLHQKNGTGQTVRYSQESGLFVINVADDLDNLTGI